MGRVDTGIVTDVTSNSVSFSHRRRFTTTIPVRISFRVGGVERHWIIRPAGEQTVEIIVTPEPPVPLDVEEVIL